MIGSFGSTDTRFKARANDALPGPGAYNSDKYNKALNTKSQLNSNSTEWSWGTGPGHKLLLAGGADNPGPGAYGTTQNLDGDILTDLRRKWPGITTVSGFGSNASTGRGGRLAKSDAPGPGQYSAEESTYFLSNAPMGTQTPFVAQARTKTGSRLQRDVDIKVGAVFASKRPAHILSFDESGSATITPKEGPSPLDTAVQSHTLHAHHQARMARLSLRSDAGTRMSFDSTDSRFKEKGGGSESAGPGAPISADRFGYDGKTLSYRRIRHAPPGSSAAKAGFNVSAERFKPLTNKAPEDVLKYLASSSAGPIGQPVHTQNVLAQVRAAGRTR